VNHAPKLGRPNCCEPVFIMICAGAWFTASVCMLRITQRSSAIPAMFGMSSENSMPDFPWGENLYLGPRSAELGLMKAAR